MQLVSSPSLVRVPRMQLVSNGIVYKILKEGAQLVQVSPPKDPAQKEHALRL